MTKRSRLVNRSPVLKCTAAVTYMATAFAVLMLLGSYCHIDNHSLYLTPIVSDTMGWEIYTVQNNTRELLTIDEVWELQPEQTYYLSRTLTQELENSGYTFLMLTSNLPCAVFFDGELLYTTCPGAVLSPDQVVFPKDYDQLSGRSESVRCTLPPHFAGSKLTIATTVGNSEYGPSLPRIVLSSEAVESEGAMAAVSSKMIPAVGFAVMALLLMLVWLFAFLLDVSNYQILLPIMAALLQAFSNLQQLEFISPSPTAADSPLMQFVPAVSVLLPLIYFWLQMRDKRIRTAFGCILGISAAAALVAPTAGLFGGLPFYSTFLTMNEVLYFPVAALPVFAFFEAKQGNTQLRLFLSGLGILISGIAVLYIDSKFGEGYYAEQITIVFRLMAERSPSSFWLWCSAGLAFLSALASLYKVIRHTVQVQIDLAQQTELSKQLDFQLSAQKDFYDARLNHEQEIRSLRHDMAGHLNTLSALLGDGKLTEARHYLDGITEQHNRLDLEAFSSNPYINAVLQNYEAKCRKHHVTLVCDIKTGNPKLPATELCLILNNALDNALEACQKLPEADRQIRVQAALHRKRFLLRISNPFRGSTKTGQSLPPTTKAGKGHGYGLSNIRRAAERRDGSMEYHVKNGTFVLDVELPLMEE